MQPSCLLPIVNAAAGVIVFVIVFDRYSWDTLGPSEATEPHFNTADFSGIVADQVHSFLTTVHYLLLPTFYCFLN